MTSRARHLRPVTSGEVPPDAGAHLVGEPDRGFIPRGMRREAAAYYVGVSPAKFDDWVEGGLMPGPKKDGGVVVWDRRKLDVAFEALPDRDGPEENPFSD